MTPSAPAAKLDATILKPEALSAEVHKTATDAMQLGLRAVVAAPVWTQRLATMLRGSGVRVVSVVGFPFGTNKSTLKAIEATSTIKDGAEEIEVVAHLPAVLSFDLDGARAELMEIVRAARSTRRDTVIRVITEIGLLARLGPERSARAVEIACRATRESGCDGLVTASGFHPAGGATAEAIALVKQYAADLTIKAAIVDDPAEAQAAIAAGADLIGTMQGASLAHRSG
jgi:deoxyribose-phosphate aldolase